MAYQNVAGAPREKAMLAAYVLINEFGWKQKHVAQGFGVSQGTVANWNKEIGYQKTIYDLTNQLQEARTLAQSMQHLIESDDD